MKIELPPELRFQQFEKHVDLPMFSEMVKKWTEADVEKWWKRAGEIDEENWRIAKANEQAEAAWRALVGPKSWFPELVVALGRPLMNEPPLTRAVVLRRANYDWVDGAGADSGTLVDVFRAAKNRDWSGPFGFARIGKIVEAAIAHHKDIRVANYGNVYLFYAAVEEAEKQRQINEKFPEGTAHHFGDCEDCDVYEVGSGRCLCGNRRVMIEVSGNIVDGFEPYLSAY